MKSLQVKKIPTSIRIDPKIKSWAQKYARTRGLDLSSLISLQLFEAQRREFFESAPYMTNERFAYYADLAQKAEMDNTAVTGFQNMSEMKKYYTTKKSG